MKRLLRREKAHKNNRVQKHPFKTNLLPAIAYGSPVNGLSNTELSKIELVAGRCLAPTCKGVSRIARRSAHRGTLDTLTAAALHIIAVEIWRPRARTAHMSYTNTEARGGLAPSVRGQGPATCGSVWGREVQRRLGIAALCHAIYTTDSIVVLDLQLSGCGGHTRNG